MNLRPFPHARLTGALLLCSLSAARALEAGTGVEVLPFTAPWDWLMVFSSGTTQVDPVTMDPDFLATWNTPAYNGPAFRPGVAPLSYGGLMFLMNPGAPQGTAMDSPSPGSRGTVYFRTTLDLPGSLNNISLDILVDDGFILYVDGVQWCSKNMRAGATSAFTEMATIVSDENSLTNISSSDDGLHLLPALTPGPHTLHVSLHNNNVNSSDLGFMLRMTGDLTITAPPQPPSLVAIPSAPSTDGSPRVLLQAKNLDPATGFIVQVSDDLSAWSAVYQFPATPERTEFSVDVPATAGRRFYRLAK